MAQKKTGKKTPKGKKNTPEREATQAAEAVGATLSEEVDEKVIFDNSTVRHVIQKVEMTRNGEVEYLIVFAQQRKATKATKGVKKGQWRNVKVSGGFRYADQEDIADAVTKL